MCPSGLEPPPGKPRTRPSTLYRKCRYVHEHPDRPYRQLFWKHWKHWTIWTLPKCCHECESPTLRCDIPRLPLSGSAFARKEQRLKTRRRGCRNDRGREVRPATCKLLLVFQSGRRLSAERDDSLHARAVAQPNCEDAAASVPEEKPRDGLDADSLVASHNAPGLLHHDEGQRQQRSSCRKE
jgi:hypothetical protein